MTQSSPHRFHLGGRHLAFRKVIVTGTCRSGKTLLARALGSMQDVEWVEEPWAEMSLPVMQALGLVDREVAKDFLRSALEELFIETVLLRRANFRPGDLSSTWRVRDANDVFSRLSGLHTRDDVRGYADERNPVLMCVLPELDPFVEFLSDTFPDAAFIHVVRSGLDVASDVVVKGWLADDMLRDPKDANTLHRVHSSRSWKTQCYLPWWVEVGEEESFLALSEFARGLYYWHRLLSTGEEERVLLAQRRPEAWLEVKFEELIGDPRAVSERLGRSLGLVSTERTAGALASIQPEQASLGKHYPLDEVQDQRLLRAVRETLVRHGYMQEASMVSQGRIT